ncbi:MAG TPA: metallophosphoesterase family protein [Jatrophihabitantaceae bacterium]
MRVAVLSDTHAPRHWKACPPSVARRLRGVDLILHAGDVCTAAVLDELAQYAPVRVVQGNNDGTEVSAWGAEPTLEFDVEGVPVAMLHDSGPAAGRAARMRRRFPHAELVVFGHSHIPWDTAQNGQRLFNPGSPTDRRRQPVGTMGLVTINAGRLRSARIVPV